MRAGKHVLVEIPVTDSVEDAENLVKIAQGNRRDRDGRPRAPLQSEPPVRSQEDRGGRTQDPADGCADLFLPPQEHQRGRPTRSAGPTTCCGIMPRTPSTCSSTRPARPSRTATRCRVRVHPELEHRDGHGHRRQGAVGRDADAVAVVQQRRAARLASSATSATTAPSRRSTTTCRDGKDNKIDVSKVDVSMDGIELSDREFIAAIREKREPNGSLAAAPPVHARARQARADHRPRNVRPTPEQS